MIGLGGCAATVDSSCRLIALTGARCFGPKPPAGRSNQLALAFATAGDVATRTVGLAERHPQPLLFIQGRFLLGGLFPDLFWFFDHLSTILTERAEPATGAHPAGVRSRVTSLKKVKSPDTGMRTFPTEGFITATLAGYQR